MSWIAKIVEGSPDEHSAARLVKYGIGEHTGPRIKLTLSKTSIKFKADLDNEKDILRAYLKGAPEGSHKVKGMIITYSDRRDEFGKLMMPLEWKKSKGKGPPVFKSKVNETAPLNDIKALLALDDPNTFYLLSLNPASGEKPWKVTTKSSFPKGGPSAGEDEEEKDPVFTKGALGRTPEVLEYVLSTFLPDFKEHVTPKTKKISIWNNLTINDIVPPKDDDPDFIQRVRELRGLTPDDPGYEKVKPTFAEKRKLAKKIGTLVRVANIDGSEYREEYSFATNS
ncbi:MAG: hypothetical protein ACP6KW_10330 [Candidatus Thorarchaeota archaeon]